MTAADTIAAIATAAGPGGIGVVRLSGPRARTIAETMCGRALRARHAHHVRFADAAGGTVDDGLALWFRAPASYTGEDVVELQAHGSPPLLRALVERAVALGARRARPGEFSERAFLNGRLDLAQAEAVADLIAAADLRAARAARRSLDGVFSKRVDALAAAMIALRVQVEAAIDFADEPIETLGGARLAADLQAAREALEALLAAARRGRTVRDGWHVVIAGPPNAGKSSLLNALAGEERAIVTEVAGTTRDLVREAVVVGGIALTLVDTAGLRASEDAIEREGMRRARAELASADLALVVVDARDPASGLAAVAEAIAEVPQRLVLLNKSDLLADAGADSTDGADGAAATADASAATADAGVPGDALRLSAHTGLGLAALHARLAALLDVAPADGDGDFSARARHVDALDEARQALDAAAAELALERLELAAESLRHAHDALGAITGRMTADDLLGRIFSTFCIGK